MSPLIKTYDYITLNRGILEMRTYQIDYDKSYIFYVNIKNNRRFNFIFSKYNIFNHDSNLWHPDPLRRVFKEICPPMKFITN